MMIVRECDRELAQLLIQTLSLDDLALEDIDPDQPLFGDSSGGWGLDSIDALEIALAIQQRYGVELRAEDEATKKAFTSLSALSNHVATCRQAA
jgi:acyl carrier protein